MKNLFSLLIFLFSLPLFSQNNTQNIRGQVVDELSKYPLIGATIQFVNTADNKGAVTDVDGKYILSEVKPGRYTLSISYLGYKPIILPNTVVTSGKEVILDINMEEDIASLKEVVVSATKSGNTVNELATISARTFSMEEVNRYAGGRSDPARLAANFAGVSAPDDSRNDIVIRGNSPIGVLWRIDGMNVTNPNHFSSVGTTGGAVSALNTNLLKTSDFFTSAFPAEYGNALSGVFDLGLRNGNNQKRETTLQMGVITGLEATTEGPFSKKNDASYLVGYRYSLAGLAQTVGIDIGTPSTPVYQDLSFKLNSGTTKAGTFSLFGILASSTISLEDGAEGSLYGNGNDTDFDSKIGILGLKHVKQLNAKSYLSSVIGLNYTKNDLTMYSTNRETGLSQSSEEQNVRKTGYNFIVNYNSKISSKLFLKAGILDEVLGVSFFYRQRRNNTTEWTQIWNEDSYTNLGQAFAHLQYKATQKLTANIGLHTQVFFLNNSTAIEPRAGLKYALNNKSSLNFGYGLHAQMQPINVYFLQTTNSENTTSYTNKALDFTKSHHLVLGYDLVPFTDWRLKAEVYYQSIYDVPVHDYSSSFSMLNTGATFKVDTEANLVNGGTGKNYGVELTIEKFFSKGFYGLFTSSIYSSKYTGSDGIERNTAFNGKYVFNILAGKEWKIGKEKRNAFTADIKYTNAGGRYHTPIDLTASVASGREVLSEDVYSVNYANYYRLDVKIGYTLNSKSRKLAHSLALDLQNVTNHDNVFSQQYSNQSESISTTYQLGFFPNFVYKFQF